jgi:uncharacterized RDD family membrane protein YckC
MEASFFRRLCAYIIDILILTLVMSIIAGIIPIPNVVQLYDKEIETAMQKVINNEISIEEYSNLIYDLAYDYDSAMVGHNIISIVIYILYFIVFQFYSNGQTIGKKIMGIKIVKDDATLTINDLVLRSIFVNGIFHNMIMIFFVLIFSRKIYSSINMPLTIAQSLFIITTVIFILFNKKGLHDIIARTKVVNKK